MIVRMKRVDLLCLEQEKDGALRDLRDLGFMHVCVGKACVGESIQRAAADLSRLERLLEAIPAHRGGRPSGLPTDELIQRGCGLLDERRRLEEDRQRLGALEAAAAPYGEFSPDDARALEARGIPVRLYRCGHEMALRVPAETVMRVLATKKGSRFFAVIGRHRPDPGWVPVPLPAQSLNAVRAELSATVDRLRVIAAELAGMGGDRMAIGREITRRREEMEFQRCAPARARLAGWFISGVLSRIGCGKARRAASERGWGLAINEPAPGEIVPTLIRNPAWGAPLRDHHGCHRPRARLPGVRHEPGADGVLQHLLRHDCGRCGLRPALPRPGVRASPKIPNGPARAVPADVDFGRMHGHLGHHPGEITLVGARPGIFAGWMRRSTWSRYVF